MEQVLRESDDGVLVYVAPTKALVAQIANEVYARFNKSMDHGMSWHRRLHNFKFCFREFVGHLIL